MKLDYTAINKPTSIKFMTQATHYMTPTHDTACDHCCSPVFNPLTPNDPYKGRTAPLTSKVAFYIFIQQI